MRRAFTTRDAILGMIRSLTDGLNAGWVAQARDTADGLREITSRVTWGHHAKAIGLDEYADRIAMLVVRLHEQLEPGGALRSSTLAKWRELSKQIADGAP